MKLVEILARELGEWPEGAALIVQDYHGEAKYQFSKDQPEISSALVWIRTPGDEPKDGEIGRLQLAADHATAIVTREMWEAERAKLEGKAEWSGEGLPPVGCPCELRLTNGVWITATPTAHGKKHMLFEDESGEERIEYMSKIQARPIRTPEQIAAQERERALDEIYRIIRTVERPGNKADMAEALYDAGYRKQEDV